MKKYILLSLIATLGFSASWEDVKKDIFNPAAANAAKEFDENDEEDSRFIKLYEEGKLNKQDIVKYISEKNKARDRIKEEYKSDLISGKFEGSEEEYLKANKNKIRGTNATGSNMTESDFSNFGNLDPGNAMKSLEDFNNMIDNGFEITYNALNVAGNIATSALSVLGAAPTVLGNGFAGASAAGTNIQAMLTKINAVKARLDELKQHKRILESLKDLSKADLKTINGINDTLNNLSTLMTSSAVASTDIRNLQDILKKVDLTKESGWDQLLGIHVDERSANEAALERIAGKSSMNALNSIRDMQREINSMEATTGNQKLEKMNNLLNVVISLLQKSITDQEQVAANNMMREQRELDEKIARSEQQKEEIKVLEKNKKELENKVKRNNYSRHMVGGR